MEKTSDYEYIMTIELSDAFLQTEGLTYPIYIDPSIQYKSIDYIDDASIYTARADEACGNHLVSYIGKYEDDYGIGRLLVRFPEMCHTDSIFRNLNSDEIISAKIYLYNSALGLDIATIGAYQFLGNSGWNESTVTWNNVGANEVGVLQSLVDISSSNTNIYYAFDITQAAKSWAENSTIAYDRLQAGIIFLNFDETDINCASKFRMSNFGTSYSPYVMINYSSIIEDGVYYLKNVGTGRYMDVEGPSTAEGAIIQQWDFHTGNQAKWYIVRQSDGYYTIQSVYSGKYVGVENDYLYDGVPIKQYTLNTGANMRWGFSISTNGNYIITAKSTGTQNKVLSVPLDTNYNGTDLIQRTYSNDSNYRDEWILRYAHVVSLNAFNESPSIARNSYFSAVQSIVNNTNGNCVYAITTDYYKSRTVSEMINTMRNSTIFTIHTHGEQNGFLLKNENSIEAWITMNNIDGVDLSHMKFALLLTCNTGTGGYSYSRMKSGNSINIVEKLVECGVENVIGFNDVTLVSECNEFAADFYELTILQGYNVKATIAYMRSSTYYNYELLNSVVRGYLDESDPYVSLNQ